MSLLHEYFRRLSEGELDISKTVEYRFIQRLQELDTPTSLNEFAKSLDMTSIVSNFINLMTKGGLISQGPEGVDTTIYDDLSKLQQEGSSSKTTTASSQPASAPPVKSESPGPRGSTSIPPARKPQQRSTPSSSAPAKPTESSNSGVPRPGTKSSPPPVKRSEPPTPGSSKPPTPGSSIPTSPSGPASSGPPRPQASRGPPKPGKTGSTQSNDDLPEHIQQKLNEERAKTGRSKGSDDDDLNKDFDSLGPLDLED